MYQNQCFRYPREKLTEPKWKPDKPKAELEMSIFLSVTDGTEWLKKKNRQDCEILEHHSRLLENPCDFGFGKDLLDMTPRRNYEEERKLIY